MEFALNDTAPSSTIPISVVVVCYNALETIAACLTSLTNQEYPDPWEVVVVDNNSTDGTLDWIRAFSQEHPRLRLLINPMRGIAVSRNIGWQQAQYDHIAYTDADCRVPSNWLSILADGIRTYSLKSVNLAAVGGSNVPPGNGSLFYIALALFLNSYLGSHGSVQGRCYDNDMAVPHLPTVNVLYKRSALQSVGGFDVGFYNIGEDRDLSFRLCRAGYTLYYLKDGMITHAMRTNFRSWFYNMFIYGKGRMWLMRRHPKEINPVLLLPMMLVIVFIMIFVGWPILLTYLAMMLGYSIIISGRAHRPASSLHLWCLFVGTHLSYGWGEWYGLFRNRNH
jgi:succinoglycan biosynthesis protein ExoA